MFENQQNLVSTRKLFILFLRITLLHEIKQNEKHPYASNTQFFITILIIFLKPHAFVKEKEHGIPSLDRAPLSYKASASSYPLRFGSKP